MGLQTIEYVASFELQDAHTFQLRRSGGWFWDTLEVKIDGEAVVNAEVGLLDQLTRHVRSLVVDGVNVELSWKWNPWSGDPKYVVLRSDERLLAAYGQDRTLQKLPMLVGTRRDATEKVAALQFVSDSVAKEDVAEVARERFPLDNTFGSDDLTVQQEITCTVSNAIKISSQGEVRARLKAGVVSILEAQVAAHLTRLVGQEVGHSITRTQRIELSVKGGSAVLYTVIWKARARSGTVTLAVDGWLAPIEYDAKFGLSFEIATARLPSDQPRGPAA